LLWGTDRGDDCFVRFVLARWLVAFGTTMAFGRTITAGFVAALIATLGAFAVFTFALIAAVITIPAISTATRAPVVTFTALNAIGSVTASFAVAVPRVFSVFIGFDVNCRRGCRWRTLAAE
jgi:hypothetical protein